MTPAAKIEAVNNNRDLLDKLKKLTVEERLSRQQQQQNGTARSTAASATLASQYQLNYRPMPVGVRKDLWEEGWRYRNLRKKDGFNHFKLEWKCLTDRSGIGVSRCHTRRGGVREGHEAAAAAGASESVAVSSSLLLETLDLPPTKLEKKRLKLKKLYERSSRRPKTSMDLRGYIVDNGDDVDGGDDWRKARVGDGCTSYERNKLNNMKSHIAMPSFSSFSSISSAGGAAGNERDDRANGDRDTAAAAVDKELAALVNGVEAAGEEQRHRLCHSSTKEVQTVESAVAAAVAVAVVPVNKGNKKRGVVDSRRRKKKF